MQSPVLEVLGKANPSAVRVSPMRVFMMDLLTIVPYYNGHLCAALRRIDGLRVDLGSITYHLDRGFFQRQQMRPGAGLAAGLIDIVSRFSIGPDLLRQGLKTIECLLNMCILMVRFQFHKPDVIHVQFLPMVKFGFPFEIWFLRAMRGMNIRIVYTVHNVLPQNTGARYRARYAEIYSMASRLICHDGCAKSRLVEEFGVDPKRISVIAHGPLLENESTQTREQARRKIGVAENQVLVLWQGILRPYKGVPFLLDAWKQVQAASGRACLAIAGSGDEGLIRGIRQQVESLGIASTVRLELRFVSVEELADFYLAADILVYPYSEITTSGALMTGIGYGKAIVASKLAAFDHLLRDGDNAMLVTYGDVDALARTLVRLIGEPRLRQRLGESARESHLSGPQWADIAASTARCYESALSGESL